MIELKDGVQFIDGYKPVETYRNGIKIAGSTPATKTGTHLMFNNTYDDYAHELTVYGNTTEIGAGDKSPDNPYEFASADGNLISSDENGTKTDTIAIPTLRRIAHAPLSINVADDYNVNTGACTRRLNEVAFNGTEAWHYNTSTSTSSDTTIYMTAASLGLLTNSQCICTHFPRSTGGSEYWVIGSLFNLRFANSRLGVTSENTQAERLAAAKAWLAARHTAGTPVKVIYQLAEPDEIQIEPTHLKTFYPFTQFYTDSEVPAELEAEVKIIGGS